jgi:hypothetical protein
LSLANDITLSDILTITLLGMLVLGGGLALVFTIRSNVAKTYKDSYEAQQIITNQLHDRLEAANASVADATTQIAALKAATDLVDHQHTMQDWNERLAAHSTAELVKDIRQVEATTAKLITEHHEAISVLLTEQTAILRDIAQQLEQLVTDRRKPA